MMNTKRTMLLATVVAFAGGYLSGLLLAPSSGVEVRRRLLVGAGGSTRWAEDRLKDLHSQLDMLEQQIQSASRQFGDRVRESTGRTLDHHVPLLSRGLDRWQIEGPDVARDLPRMPH